jgi:hypothetical protein
LYSLLMSCVGLGTAQGNGCHPTMHQQGVLTIDL